MASRKGILAKPSYVFAATSHTEGVSEFDEAELWNSSSNAKPVTEATNKRASREADTGGRGSSVVSSGSLPVNIPDWAKILKEDYRGNRKKESDEDEGDEDGEIRIPPHEYLARTRGASFSVHEGIGRTLKGRDLRSVRNAIWKKVGFED